VEDNILLIPWVDNSSNKTQ